MIDPLWKRIAGIHCQEEGQIGAVWLALDKDSDTIHLYDCCIFRGEVLAVVAEGLNCRGRWVPIAWEEKAKAISDKLLERGCNMLYDPYKDTQSLAAVNSTEILTRMKTGRFKVSKRLSEWLDEYRTFYKDDSQVPTDTHPLMQATRHAVAQIQYAKRQASRKKAINHPKIAVL